MTHQRYALILPALIAFACGGGDGDQTSVSNPNRLPSIANQQPKSADQPPAITGAPVPNDTELPFPESAPQTPGGPGGGACESFCNRALAANCSLNGVTDCGSACEELNAQPCPSQLFSLANCALGAGVCPDAFDDNTQLIAAACESQAQAYGDCRDAADK
jgi:hypothetical protein